MSPSMPNPFHSISEVQLPPHVSLALSQYVYYLQSSGHLCSQCGDIIPTSRWIRHTYNHFGYRPYICTWFVEILSRQKLVKYEPLF